MLPTWAKADTKPRINARSETAFVKPFRRDAIRSRRCVLGATGSYEWSGEPGHKVRHLFERRDRSPIALAVPFMYEVVPVRLRRQRLARRAMNPRGRNLLAAFTLAITIIGTSPIARADEPRTRGWDIPDASLGIESTPHYSGAVIDFAALELAAGGAWNDDVRAPYLGAALHFDFLGFADANLSHWFNPFVGLGNRWQHRSEGIADVGLEFGLSPTRIHPFLRIAYRLDFGHGAEHLVLAAVGLRLRSHMPHGPIWQPRRLRE